MSTNPFSLDFGNPLFDDIELTSDPIELPICDTPGCHQLASINVTKISAPDVFNIEKLCSDCTESQNLLIVDCWAIDYRSY